MQVGRWNHQSSGGNSSSSSSGGSSRPYSPRPSTGGRSGSSYPARTGGYGASRGPARSGGSSYGGRPSFGGNRGRGPVKRGFGTFGETEAEIAKFMNRTVVTTEEPVFVPEHTFADFDINAKLKANILGRGYNEPTPIQDKSIPHALLGQDVVGLAETGTGKTAAFLIPLIDKVMKQKGERVLIMAPTRELAVQIEKELAGFAKGLGFRGMVAVGGANIGPQIQQLKHDPAFVIGTPGRLKDLMERRALELSGFGTVVLDEADRMLDMGFIDDMKMILAKMRKERHTLFFSATMSKEIERLVGAFLNQPVVISVKTQDTSRNVDQDVVRIPRGKDKFDVLAEMLKGSDFSRVLVFGRTKFGVEKLAKALSRLHIHAESIHGNKTYGARIRALEAFKSGKVSALVATDVAARGLDIPAVSHVINFDLPSTYEDYVHRIGRTGRGSLKGKALTFVQER
ncbi:MAG: putative box helicase domain protein [Parcubacteria group bacterium]|nr:putative box helicase domain protein [Parcubacteria group bacterium]